MKEKASMLRNKHGLTPEDSAASNGLLQNVLRKLDIAKSVRLQGEAGLVTRAKVCEEMIAVCLKLQDVVG